MILKDYIREVKHRLGEAVGTREAYWMVRDIFDVVKGYSEVDLLVKGDDELSDFIVEKINKIVERVELGEPLQYVHGVARFAGMQFKVTNDTLIPRPETQELVDLIILRHGNEKDLRVIDVGTGSGCIAISLARGLKFPQICAIDISQNAIDVAKENAKSLKTKVKFECRDALSLKAINGEQYDIIVSNPPYIACQERDDMEKRVLDYEPESALFVPDDNPLCFYRAITQWGCDVLNLGGRIYFEINPLFASEMVAMMSQMGYSDIEIIKDMQVRDRMLCARFIGVD